MEIEQILAPRIVCRCNGLLLVQLNYLIHVDTTAESLHHKLNHLPLFVVTLVSKAKLDI